MWLGISSRSYQLQVREFKRANAGHLPDCFDLFARMAGSMLIYCRVNMYRVDAVLYKSLQVTTMSSYRKNSSGDGIDLAHFETHVTLNHRSRQRIRITSVLAIALRMRPSFRIFILCPTHYQIAKTAAVLHKLSSIYVFLQCLRALYDVNGVILSQKCTREGREAEDFCLVRLSRNRQVAVSQR